jgi:hypothetical protein
MKDYCKKIFLRYYGDALGVNNTETESQDAYEDDIAYNVRQLIGKPSLFHYGPEDLQASLPFAV